MVVANNKAYGGGMYIAPDAELDDGEFDVVTIGKVGKLRFLGNLPRCSRAPTSKSPEVQRHPRRAASALSASRPFAVYADGERLTDLPADLRVIPRALRVLVPPPPLERRGGERREGRGGPAFGAKRALARAIGAASRRRPRRRHDAAGTGAAAAGAGGDREARGRARRRRDDRLGDQRQDDDGGDDRRDPRRRGPAAGPQPGGSNMTWASPRALLEQRGTRGALRGRRGLAAAGRASSWTLA